MYRGALVSGFVNSSVYFNKLAKPLDRLLFWKKKKILLVISTEVVTHFFIFRPNADAICQKCSTSGDDSRKLWRSLF